MCRNCFESAPLRLEVKAALIDRLTQTSVEITGIPREFFLVTIRELPDSDIAVGGETVSNLKARLSTG
jgi:4-oxalocrotonate tautomerase